MKYEDRISELEKEISMFDYERLKRQEQVQQMQISLQQKLSDISEAILTRRGEIFGLKRLITGEEKGSQRGVDTT